MQCVRAGRWPATSWRRFTGRKLEPHHYRGIGMPATLGRHWGVGRVFGVTLTGFLAWFAWRTYYLFMLPLWERRFRVAFDWTLDLLFPPDIVELKVEPLQTGREALTPGSVSAEESWTTQDKTSSAPTRRPPFLPRSSLFLKRTPLRARKHNILRGKLTWLRPRPLRHVLCG